MVIVISPRTARRYLRDIRDPHMQFHTVDGKTLKNLIELTMYLRACELESFHHHVSREHNHFSNWVEHSVLDKDLAHEMSLVLDKNPMRIIVMRRVNILVHHATRTPRGREFARMVLEDAQLPEEHFVSNDGRTIRNLWELKEFLETVPDNVFIYHVNYAKNDIYEWIADVLMDLELASRIFALSEREEMAWHIMERLSQLEAFQAHKPRGHDLESYIEMIREGRPAACAIDLASMRTSPKARSA